MMINPIKQQNQMMPMLCLKSWGNSEEQKGQKESRLQMWLEKF